jgi:hypothetical protein
MNKFYFTNKFISISTDQLIKLYNIKMDKQSEEINNNKINYL